MNTREKINQHHTERAVQPEKMTIKYVSKISYFSSFKDYLVIGFLSIFIIKISIWLVLNTFVSTGYSQQQASSRFVPLPGVNTRIESDYIAKEDNQGNTVIYPANKLLRSQLAEILNFPAGMNNYPTRVNINAPQFKGMLNIEYTLDQLLQEKINEWVNRYNSDYAAVAVIDANTGEIKALSSHVADGYPYHNLAVNAYYPGASTFKLVTAAAAINEGLLKPSSVIPYDGSSVTLYKKQISEVRNDQWTRKPTLTQAFAKSVNPVFGRIGEEVLGYDTLAKYAKLFGFNRRFRTDIEISPSLTGFDNADKWTLVEAGSGYTQDTLLSPLHGALMSAIVINGGILKLPHWVKKAEDDDGKIWYEGVNVDIDQILKPSTTDALKLLMKETVKTGTARKSFRQYLAKAEKNGIEIGGKTGTLRGRGPNNEIKGLHDWFIGYASQGDTKIAFGVLHVSEDKWKVKSHYLAKQLIDYYFFNKPSAAETVN